VATLPLETNVYHALERVLQARTVPATCVDLFDVPEIRAIASDVNAVSDALGNLYRRGYLYREPAAKTPRSQAKWAYAWKRVKAPTPFTPEAQHDMAVRAEDARPRSGAPVTGRTLLDKPTIRISETGGRVVIDLGQLRITIESGPGG